MITQPDSDTALHIAKSFAEYYPALAAELDAKYPKLRLEHSSFENLMPLLVAGEVPHGVMLWLLNGDNWKNALIDLFLAHVFTQNIDVAGANVGELTLFAPFIDSRMDKRGSKVIPGDPNGNLAIVKGQASLTQPIAEMMKHVAGVRNVVNIDGHSPEFAEQLEELGIEYINVTSAFFLLDELERKGLINDELENVICGVDFGNLALSQKISQERQLQLAIIQKRRDPIVKGEESKTTHELVYGDVRGKRVILMDDMISSGGTIIETVELLLAQGAKEILVCAAHAVFAGRDYYNKLVKLLKIPEVKIVMTTDTLPLNRPGYGNSKSLAYVDTPSEKDSETEVEQSDGARKEVEIYPIQPFIGQIVQALMASHSADEVRLLLEKYIVKHRDPYEIYEEITGIKLEKPRKTAVYKEGGVIEPLPTAV